MSVGVGVLWGALTLGAVGAEKAPSWEFASRKNDLHVAFVKLRGGGPGGACDATLVFSRSRGAERKPVTKNNATTPPIVVELWLTNSKQVAPFKLEDFEGPDAPAGKQVTVTLVVQGKPRTWKLPQSGWFSPLRDGTGADETHAAVGEPESFVFGLGDSVRGYRDLVQIADLLAAGADSLKIEIAAHGKSSAKLGFEVPIAGASEALQPLMAR